MIRAALHALLTIALLLTPTLVQARPMCGRRADMIQQLTQTYSEVQIGFGFANANIIIEIWASNEPPYTWTILKTYTSGTSCVLAVGTLWRGLTPDYSTPTGAPI